MAEPFLSEIRICSFVFAPKGWALCNGQLLPINQNQALFSLLGTTFGGDGRVNFALPDLRGRIPIHVGSGHSLGERGGEQAHTLSIRKSRARACGQCFQLGRDLELPLARRNPGPVQHIDAMAHRQPGCNGAKRCFHVGGSQAHFNMQPFLILSFCIALQGIFPSPT